MRQIKYIDLLWDFTLKGSGRGDPGMKDAQAPARLQVFNSEQEMFERRGKREPYLVVLPMDWARHAAKMRSKLGEGSSLPPDLLLQGGYLLWQALPPEARQPLEQAVSDQPVRLKISSNSPTIDDLPWEWLNDGSRPPFALLEEVRLSRSVPIRLAMPPMSIQPPIRVLVVLTNPRDQSLLDPVRELKAIRSRLSRRPYKVRLLDEPSFSALAEALQEGPHIVHYIGHAGVDRGQGNLILHSASDVTQWISAPELSKLLPPTVRLLCLSTCFTAPNYQILGLPRLAHATANYRLPTVVTNRYPVQEAGVRLFWRAFYAGLVQQDGNVNEGFHLGQSAVAGDPDTQADWGSYSLVIRDQTGEALRLERATEKSPDQYTAQIQAQFATQLANDLAQQLRAYGDSAPENLQKLFEEEADAAASLLDDY
ncbi:MAG: CHAT domain-containing protein [Anaerolineales bacterium]|nr:CHAT domain-containing protein [Anaerolineales bacterium]